MDNNQDSDQGCDCSSDCCQPPRRKNKLWMKIIFIVIVLAVAVIVTVKLVGINAEEQTGVADTVNTALQPGCDTSGVKCVRITNPGQNQPCCPQSKQ